MGTTAAIIDSTLITDRGSRDKLGREMDDALLRFRSRFCRSAFRYLGNAADAEDAVQDALLSAYKYIGQLRGQARISTMKEHRTGNPREEPGDAQFALKKSQPEDF